MNIEEIESAISKWVKSDIFQNHLIKHNLFAEANERHLHHIFSTWLSRECSIDVRASLENTERIVLFPEWPTSEQELKGPKDIFYSQEEVEYLQDYPVNG